MIGRGTVAGAAGDLSHPTEPFRRARGKVTIAPAAPIAAEEEFTVELHYHGVPHKITGVDGTAEPQGWYRTSDGAFALGEPVGTPTWLACDDAPRDKASFDIAITVPAKVKAVCNGALISRRNLGGRVRWTWSGRRRSPPT